MKNAVARIRKPTPTIRRMPIFVKIFTHSRLKIVVNKYLMLKVREKSARLRPNSRVTGARYCPLGALPSPMATNMNMKLTAAMT